MKRLITTNLLILLLGLAAAGIAAADDPAGKDFDYAKVDLRAGIWLDKGADEVYRGGERMSVGFQVNRDAYAVVYRIDTEGQVEILWPRTRLDDGFVFGGHEYEVPVAGSEPLLTNREEGEGFVEIIASIYPFDLRGLEIDFHGEDRRDPYRYEVAGDPFLAMNDINYAVTGLEDTEDYVVTNYASYYVHRKVDHPRYLCTQCHVDDDVRYDPYEDRCTLDIEYDYGWSNRWYDTYGYYPVYAQPVYVYVDPWTYRPWVNFWYWPSYVCGPTLGYSWYGGAWVWYDSPYYWGDVYTYYDGGGRRYRPLTPGDGSRTARKTREYGRVTPLVDKDGPDARSRTAMTRRTPVADPGERVRTPSAAQGVAGTGNRGAALRREDPVRHTGRVVDPSRDTRTRSQLVIRQPGESAGDRTRTRTSYRHVSGTEARKPALQPVDPGSRVRSPAGPRNPGASGRSPAVRSPRTPGSPSSRTIRPVEPHRRGTRIWNSGGTGTTRSREPAGRTTPRAAPRNDRSRTRVQPAPKVTPRKERSGSERSSGQRSRTQVRERSDRGRDTGRSSTPARTGSGSRGSAGKSAQRGGGGSRRR